MSDDLKDQFMARVNALFDPHPPGLNLEQFSTVVQEVSLYIGEQQPEVQLVGQLDTAAAAISCTRSQDAVSIYHGKAVHA